MLIQKPGLELKFFLTKNKEHQIRLYEQLLQIGECNNPNDVKKLVDEYAELHAKMSQPQSINFYLHYYDVVQKLIASISLVMGDMHGTFKWVYGSKEIQFKSFEYDPVIALFNCAVCIQNEPGLYDVNRVQKMQYYIQKAIDVCPETFEHINLPDISQTLLVIAQECVLLNFMQNPPIAQTDFRQPLVFGQNQNQSTTQETVAPIPQLPQLDFPDVLPAMPAMELQDQLTTDTEHEISHGLDAMPVGIPNLPDLPDLPQLVEFSLRPAIPSSQTVKKENNLESPPPVEQPKQEITLPDIPTFEADIPAPINAQIGDTPTKPQAEPEIQQDQKVEKEKNETQKPAIPDAEDTEPVESIQEQVMITMPTSAALEEVKNEHIEDITEKSKLQSGIDDNIFLGSTVDITAEPEVKDEPKVIEAVETLQEHVDQIEKTNMSTSVPNESENSQSEPSDENKLQDVVKTSNDEIEEQIEQQESIKNTENAFPKVTDFILPEKIQINIKAFTKEQKTELTQNTHIISQAYKNIYRASKKQKESFDYGELVKGKYEIYKMLSKYFFCDLLNDISRQYSKLVAEQTIKEANPKYSDSEIIEELREFVKYDIQDEVKMMMENPLKLDTVQTKYTIEDDNVIFYPKKYSKIIEKTFNGLQDSLSKRQAQLQTQRQAFLDKIKVVRQYLNNSKTIVPQVDKLQNFAQMVDSLLSQGSVHASRSPAQIQQEVKQLQDMNALAKQSYDYLAQLVSTDEANKKSYSEKRWNSQKYIQSVYRLMQDIVQTAEKLQKQMVAIQTAVAPAHEADQQSDEVAAIKAILDGADSLIASKSLTISVHLENLKKVEEQITVCLDKMSSGLVEIKTVEQLKKYIKAKNLQLKFDDRGVGGSIEHNRKVVQQSMECDQNLNQELEQLDIQLSEIYQQVSKYNLSFVETAFKQKCQMLERIGEKYVKSDTFSKKPVDTTELLNDSRQIINTCNAKAKSSSKRYAEQVQQQWRQFASSQNYVMVITM